MDANEIMKKVGCEYHHLVLAITSKTISPVKDTVGKYVYTDEMVEPMKQFYEQLPKRRKRENVVPQDTEMVEGFREAEINPLPIQKTGVKYSKVTKRKNYRK